MATSPGPSLEVAGTRAAPYGNRRIGSSARNYIGSIKVELKRMVQGARGGRRLVASVARGVSVILIASCMAACQEERSDEAKPLPSVSLYGVRTGMTPSDLQAAFPGVYCSPTVEHPRCSLAASVPGTKEIEVAFRDGVVVSAQALDETNTVRARLVEQLGPPQGSTEDHAGSVWRARDGVELQVIPTHSRSGFLTTRLVLATTEERSRWAEEKGRERKEAVAAMRSLLAEVLEVGPDGRISVCGLRVGDQAVGKLGCATATHMKFEVAGAKGCPSRGPDFFEAPAPCLSVGRLEGTSQYRSITVVLPVKVMDLDALRVALLELLDDKQNQPSLYDDFLWLPPKPVFKHQGSRGDVLIVTPRSFLDDIVTPAGYPDPLETGSPGVVTLEIHGRGASEDTFQ